LSGPQLADLYADLTIQDKVERELKKMKAEDRDQDGLKEAEVRERRLGKYLCLKFIKKFGGKIHV